MVRGSLAAAGMMPVVCLALHAAWGVPLAATLWGVLVPAALLASGSMIYRPDLGRHALLGWLAGVVATVPYDALRFSALGLGLVEGDPVPGWGEALAIGAPEAAGYALRYFGNGGGLGLTFAMLVGSSPVRRMHGAGWGAAVCLALFATLVLHPWAAATLFPLDGWTVAVVGAGHLVWGLGVASVLAALRRVVWTGTVRMVTVVGLNLVLVAAEGGGAWVSGSFALGSEALHDLGDVVSLAVALAASLWMARCIARPGRVDPSRVSVLAAFVNGLFLLVGAGAVILHLVGRVGAHEVEHAAGVFAVALLGLALNGLSAVLLIDDARHDFNARAVLVHMGADALGSLGALLAAGLTLAGLHVADLVGGVVLAVAVGGSALWLLQSSAAVLLVGPAPREAAGGPS
jgi:cation diffusion facilitator family transporter